LEEMDGVLIKIDFEKAYDNVRWHFLTAGVAYERFSSEMV
jgi:hypothetical protein